MPRAERLIFRFPSDVVPCCMISAVRYRYLHLWAANPHASVNICRQSTTAYTIPVCQSFLSLLLRVFFGYSVSACEIEGHLFERHAWLGALVGSWGLNCPSTDPGRGSFGLDCFYCFPWCFPSVSVASSSSRPDMLTSTSCRTPRARTFQRWLCSRAFSGLSASFHSRWYCLHRGGVLPAMIGRGCSWWRFGWAEWSMHVPCRQELPPAGVPVPSIPPVPVSGTTHAALILPWPPSPTPASSIQGPFDFRGLCGPSTVHPRERRRIVSFFGSIPSDRFGLEREA